ncbi:DUF998 domain-containing protein [Lacimicrobium alkaliphilum]|uniref:DUF998 domain-containing protein n=1 Tax=Lacimicrobium alkaliphilum TaxID=1526571 RepID=A0ABQ1R4V2_9ALTE|nr:DUF998 domain-containing protein [Lacimicrobium alkaliphilum]GGD54734.1 hypothetical protein GCM10011357_08040 [Lacimicrobium alkaliphilum]
MKGINSLLIKQGHLVWIFSIINIGLGVVIPGFDFFAKSISHVALEAPVFAYIHRVADIVIGLSMCLFALGIQVSSPGRFSVAMLSTLLLGISMISAGIWTLESPLHLLYNLSIFMIIVPMAFALEFKNTIRSETFENFSVAVTLLHVFMFWMIYAGFIPSELNGLIQRIWAIPTMGWFGVAAYMLGLQQFLANKQTQSMPG